MQPTQKEAKTILLLCKKVWNFHWYVIMTIHVIYGIWNAARAISFFPSYSPLQKSRLSHKNRRSPIRYGFLAGTKAIRFSVKTANVNVYSCPTCTERLQPRTNWKVNAKYGCYYIHFSVSNLPPGELTFFGGGGEGGGRWEGAEESVLSDKGHLRLKLPNQFT